jgi:CRISPR-associated protein Cas5t
MKIIGLYVSVPVAGFRVPRAREYFETFPIPPPATIYGMLLSIVGETNRRVHEGTEIAIGLLSEPEYSVNHADFLRECGSVKNIMADKQWYVICYDVTDQSRW